MINFRTYEDLSKVINENLDRIPNDIDLIVGVPRSGMVPATMISTYKNIPLTDIQTFINGTFYEPGITKRNKKWIKSLRQAKKVLIVEDSCDSGNSIKKVKKEISKLNFNIDYTFLAIYCTSESRNIVDMTFEICEDPRFFEWNYLHHSALPYFCFDIDGVLCKDPTLEQNDDGAKYINFISNIQARFIPTYSIGYLVTSRLEKYRDLTDQWLVKNNIKYKKMYMMKYKSGEERARAGNHGVFKGKIYKKLKDAILFVESEPWQAEIINKISNKSVFCTGNQKFYPENSINNNSIKTEIVESYIKKTVLYRILRKIKHFIIK